MESQGHPKTYQEGGKCVFDVDMSRLKLSSCTSSALAGRARKGCYYLITNVLMIYIKINKILYVFGAPPEGPLEWVLLFNAVRNLPGNPTPQSTLGRPDCGKPQPKKHPHVSKTAHGATAPHCGGTILERGTKRRFRARMRAFGVRMINLDCENTNFHKNPGVYARGRAAPIFLLQ